MNSQFCVHVTNMKSTYNVPEAMHNAKYIFAVYSNFQTPVVHLTSCVGGVWTN
jgi:hypothetical protein